MATVSLLSVSKDYPGGVRAVSDLSLEVADGEFLVLVGPSGCGKSTTLRMIAGLERVSAGGIRIDELPVDSVEVGKRRTFIEPRDRDLAMVFQSYALYPHMSVEQNLAFPLKMRKYPRAERARVIGDTAELLGLRELLKRRPAALSGGQRQRVALGRALVRRAGLYLFDEPLSNLDAKLRLEMRTELKRLHQRLGVTMIYVTHDQVEAMTLGDRIAVMHEGLLQQIGTPETVYRKPNNRFVARFIGHQPMNFLAGRLDGGALVVDSARFPLAGAPAGERLVLAGVRPEHLRRALGGADEPFLEAAVEIVEYLGHERLLSLTGALGPLLLREQADGPIEVGDALRLSVATQDWHLFDAESETRIA